MMLGASIWGVQASSELPEVGLSSHGFPILGPVTSLQSRASLTHSGFFASTQIKSREVAKDDDEDGGDDDEEGPSFRGLSRIL